MDIYFTSKNQGPSWTVDPITLKYVGTSLDDAIKAVGDFVQYETDQLPKVVEGYYALPIGMHPKPWFVKFYMADGWWFSIVRVTFE